MSGKKKRLTKTFPKAEEIQTEDPYQIIKLEQVEHEVGKRMTAGQCVEGERTELPGRGADEEALHHTVVAAVQQKDWIHVHVQALPSPQRQQHGPRSGHVWSRSTH